MPMAPPCPGPNETRAPKQKGVAGADVLILDGYLLAWLSRSEKTLLCFIEPETVPDPTERERLVNALAEALVALLHQRWTPQGRAPEQDRRSLC